MEVPLARLMVLWVALTMPALAAPPPPAPPAPPPPVHGPPPGVEEWAIAKEQELLGMVEEHAPERLPELMVLRESDPARYFVALRQVARVSGRLDDPEELERFERVRELEARIAELGQGFSEASAGEQKKRRAEAERIAGELFDLKQAQRQRRVEELEAKLAKLEQDVAEREKRRDQIVKRFVDERLEPTPGL